MQTQSFHTQTPLFQGFPLPKRKTICSGAGNTYNWSTLSNAQKNSILDNYILSAQSGDYECLKSWIQIFINSTGQSFGQRVDAQYAGNKKFNLSNADVQELIGHAKNRLELSELYIYGSGRLGQMEPNLTLAADAERSFVYNPFTGAEIDPSVSQVPPIYTTSATQKSFVIGQKRYEISNHLGNVSSVITDRKFGVPLSSTDPTISYYLADIVSATDYDPYGQALPGRVWNRTGYRFGFNGQELDSELGEVWSAEFWEYDASLGRRWDIDPIDLPWQSPYVAFDCNPIAFSDPKGLMSAPVNSGGGGGGGGPKGGKGPKAGGGSGPTGPKGTKKFDLGIEEIKRINAREEAARKYGISPYEASTDERRYQTDWSEVISGYKDKKVSEGRTAGDIVDEYAKRYDFSPEFIWTVMLGECPPVRWNVEPNDYIPSMGFGGLDFYFNERNDGTLEFHGNDAFQIVNDDELKLVKNEAGDDVLTGKINFREQVLMTCIMLYSRRIQYGGGSKGDIADFWAYVSFRMPRVVTDFKQELIDNGIDPNTFSFPQLVSFFPKGATNFVWPDAHTPNHLIINGKTVNSKQYWNTAENKYKPDGRGPVLQAIKRLATAFYLQVLGGKK